ncbi:hypothetical protein EB061_01220 [bacterium]|nr:hypothetical protein [bacterium]
MRKHKSRNGPEAQLSLFEPTPQESPTFQTPPKKDATVLDFLKARFENGPEMSQEEYRRWIKVLVNRSLKRLE